VTISFSDLRVGAYCPRQLYYRRQESDRTPPPNVTARRSLAFRYPEILDRSPTALTDLPFAVPPKTVQTRLRRAREQFDAWEQLADPPMRDVFLSGDRCHGVARKLLEAPLRPVVVSPGKPPGEDVWTTHAVQAVATANALADERDVSVSTAFVEYPAYGRIRRVPITSERQLAYRRVLHAVETLGSPPPRRQTGTKCEPCQYRDRCGVAIDTVERSTTAD